MRGRERKIGKEMSPALSMNPSGTRNPANPAGTAGFAVEPSPLATSVSIEPSEREMPTAKAWSETAFTSPIE